MSQALLDPLQIADFQAEAGLAPKPMELSIQTVTGCRKM